MKNEKKMNNKGFSLVELIIVIAIMAVLVAVLAPQYMKFVERGRVASDEDNIDAIISAVQVYAVDVDRPSTHTFTTAGATVTIERGAAAVAGDDAATIRAALASAGLPSIDNEGTTANAIPVLTNKETLSKVVLTIKLDANKNVKIDRADTRP